MKITQILKKEEKKLLLFCGPFLVIYIMFFVFPLVDGVIMSFTNTNGFTDVYDIVYFDNYIKLLTNDERFHASFTRTIIFTVINVVVGNFLALLLAFVIESGIRGKRFFRTMFFLPYVFALIIIGFTWKFIFVQWIPEIGELLQIKFLIQDYLGNPKIALYSVIIMQIWYQLGYYLVIYIAGMQSIDTTIVEATEIDGANTFQKYTKVVMPLLYPAMSICIFTGLASSLKAFDAVLALTGGGPGYATEVISLNIYYEAMGEAQQYGYGMAKSIVLAIFIFAVTAVQRKFFEKREVEA
ncbi:MAG: sugar ABC transporter permease [Eubacteriales bacterium]